MSTVPWAPDYLSSQILLEVLREPYSLSPRAQCVYLTSGLHHVYIVTDNNSKRVCRVYRRSWRSHQSALYELDVLDQLRNQVSPVAYPLPTHDGRLAIDADTPKGPSTIALFTYAHGVPPGPDITVEQVGRLGEAVAGLHLAMATVVPKYQRPALDLGILIDKSLRSLTGHLTPKDLAELRVQAEQIRQRMPLLPLRAPYFGVVHGDINLKNLHYSGEELTFFDFDQCGPGWYAFDIGKFFHAIAHLKTRDELQQRFLQAYLAIRPLTAVEGQAIPLFAVLAQLWIMAIHASNAEYLRDLLTPGFWEKKMRRWRTLADSVLE